MLVQTNAQILADMMGVNPNAQQTVKIPVKQPALILVKQTALQLV